MGGVFARMALFITVGRASDLGICLRRLSKPPVRLRSGVIASNCCGYGVEMSRRKYRLFSGFIYGKALAVLAPGSGSDGFSRKGPSAKGGRVLQSSASSLSL